MKYQKPCHLRVVTEVCPKSLQAARVPTTPYCLSGVNKHTGPGLQLRQQQCPHPMQSITTTPTPRVCDFGPQVQFNSRQILFAPRPVQPSHCLPDLIKCLLLLQKGPFLRVVSRGRPDSLPRKTKQPTFSFSKFSGTHLQTLMKETHGTELLTPSESCPSPEPASPPGNTGT